MCDRIRQEHVIIYNDGPDKNVLTFTPPMCFTCENAKHVIGLVHKHLREIEFARMPGAVREVAGESVEVTTTALDIPLGVAMGVDPSLTSSDDDSDDDDDDANGAAAKKRRFVDLD